MPWRWAAAAKPPNPTGPPTNEPQESPPKTAANYRPRYPITAIVAALLQLHSSLSLRLPLHHRHPERSEGSLYFAVACSCHCFCFCICHHPERSEEPRISLLASNISNNFTKFPQKYSQNLLQIRIHRKGNPPSTFTTQSNTICPQNTTHNIPPAQKPLKNPQPIKQKNIQPIRKKARSRSGASSRCRKKESW
jgi:hypothetical protein